jgi:hypothetical protein
MNFSILPFKLYTVYAVTHVLKELTHCLLNGLIRADLN